MSNEKLNPDHYTPTQWLYYRVFGDIPQRDMATDDKFFLADIFRALDEQEKAVINMRCGINRTHKMTFRAIGEELNLSEARVSQIETKAIRKLNHPDCAERLKHLYFTYGEWYTEEVVKRDKLLASTTDKLRAAEKENEELRMRLIALGEMLPVKADATKHLCLKIDTLGFSVRTYNSLKRACVNTLEDIALIYQAHGIEGLLKIRNLGRKSAEEVVAKITAMGIFLAPDENQNE